MAKPPDLEVSFKTIESHLTTGHLLSFAHAAVPTTSTVRDCYPREYLKIC